MSEWKSIETAPRDGTQILGVRFEKYPDGSSWFVDGAIMQWEGGPDQVLKGVWTYAGISVRLVAEDDLPTHWLPLPPPPENAP